MPGTWEFVWYLGQHVRNVTALTLTLTARSAVTNMTSVYTPTVVLCACADQAECDYFVSSQAISSSDGAQPGTTITILLLMHDIILCSCSFR